jgi:curved DNA-binding protein CbpA
MVYDYYKILEISRDASLDDIKRAYRSKAKIMHPDVNDSPKANEVFILINEAYEVLIDDRKRYLHDIKLNYSDAVKIDNQRKKHYYGTSKGISRTDFTTNRNKGYPNENYQVKKEEDYYNQSPFLYNSFFISGMFVGFLILIVTIMGTIEHYWPAPFGLISLAGIALIRDGWKGFLGKRTIVSGLVKLFRK